MNIANIPYAGKSYLQSPSSKLDDNPMYLGLVFEGISRSRVIEYSMKSESGEIFESDYSESLFIKAFLMEPLTSNGHLFVDGEEIPLGPIQGEVIPKLVNCISK